MRLLSATKLVIGAYQYCRELIYPSIQHLYDRRGWLLHQNMQIVLVECLYEILDNSALPDVLSIGRTSKAFHQAVKIYITRRVDRCLKPWLSDRLAFRHQLKDNSAILSGSFVLALATAPSWTPRDLDIYVGSTSGFHNLHHYLKESEGYTNPPLRPHHQATHIPPTLPHPFVHDNHPSSSPFQRGISDYRRLVKSIQVNGQPTDVSIDLILTRSRHPADLVLQFPASCVMNWLTANEIILTYPDLTCNEIALLHPHHQPPVTGFKKTKENAWLDKYTARGFKLVATVDDSVFYECGSACPHLRRHTYDKACARIPYGQDEWSGPKQVDPTLCWPAPQYRPAVANCLHSQCPQNPSPF